jgi:hypothetical protein
MLSRLPWNRGFDLDDPHLSDATRKALLSTRKALLSKQREYLKHLNGFQLDNKVFLDLVKVTATMMRSAEPTAFRMEAPTRHSLRAGLCLQGWPWIIADLQADSVVRHALRRIGARRPRWIEGQREYTDGAWRDDLCWQCGEPLPSHAKKFCSESCFRSFPRIGRAFWPEKPSRYWEQLMASLKAKRRASRGTSRRRRRKVKRSESEPAQCAA